MYAHNARLDAVIYTPRVFARAARGICIIKAPRDKVVAAAADVVVIVSSSPVL